MNYKEKYIKYKNKYLNLKGGTVCSIKSKQKSYFYYVCSNKPETQLVSTSEHLHCYNFDEIKRMDYETFAGLLECNNNIYFYLELIDEETAIAFNKLLLDTVTGSETRYYNVSIINFTKSQKKVIYNLKNNGHNMFKKVLNIFPIKFDMCLVDSIPKSGLQFNKSIIIDESELSNKQKCSRLSFEDDGKYLDYNILAGGSVNTTREIIYKVINLKLDDIKTVKSLHETWWYKYFLDTPYCAYGRLLQSTGTCWCNASINSLFLSEPIVQLLIDSFNNPLASYGNEG
jgi:hypothetical protein